MVHYLVSVTRKGWVQLGVVGPVFWCCRVFFVAGCPEIPCSESADSVVGSVIMLFKDHEHYVVRLLPVEVYHEANRRHA